MTVYLIWWPPKCGKTTLAKELSKKLMIPWISADTLQNIVYAYTPKKTHKKIFPNSQLRGDNNDETYSRHHHKAIIKWYINQGKTSYKAISMVAETYLIDKDDIVVEWYQVTPEIVEKIIKKFGKKNIQSIFLVKHDEKQFVKDIHKSTTPNDWIIRKTKEENTFHKIAKMISEYSKYFEKEARKHKFTVFTMDQDFKKQIKKAIQLLTKK